MANIEDGATGTVLTAPSPQSSGTTLNLNSGETLRFPTPPFWAIAHPNSQIPVKSIAEKILVTAMNTGTDQITFVRAQGGYSAKNIDVGWRISNAIFKDDFNNASIVNNEVPTGSINGSNTAFTLASSVHTNGSLMVHKNGVRMKGGGDDFTETATGFTMTTAPATGTVLLVDYVITGAINNVGTNSLITDETPTGSVNGSNTTFTAARAYIPGSLEVHINGVKQKRVTHFTETTPASGIFTMGDAPLTGDDIMINYAFNLNPSGNTDTVDGYHANATPTANQIPVLDGNAMLPNSTLGGAWTAWTPTFTLSGGVSWGNGVLTGRYTQIGKTVKFWAKFQLGSTTNFSGLTGISMTLPVTASSTWPTPSTVGQAFFTGFYGGETVITSSTSVDIYVFIASGTYLSPSGITQTIPVSWAAGNSAVITGLYEAA